MKEILINSPKFGVHKVLVDDEDYEILKSRTWCINVNKHQVYAETKEKRVISIMMHRLIMGVSDPNIFIDHKDGNGLNNQRSNLRIATRSQNLCNRGSVKNSRSKFKGVAWVASHQLWRATIQKEGIFKFLGYFKSDIDAAKAYDKEAQIFHGEFAKLNFPLSETAYSTFTKSL